MTQPNPNLAAVRRMTRLTTTELSEDDAAGYLADNADSPRLAAADALEAFASTLLDVANAEGLTVSGSKRASTLMARAARLREQAAAETDDDEDFFFDVVPTTTRRGELTERRIS